MDNNIEMNHLPSQEEEGLNLMDLLHQCLQKWRWFVVSVVVVMGLAFFYLLRTPSVFSRSATVLIKDDKQGGGISSEMDAFSDMGLFKSSSNVDNEIIAFKSPALMTEVVKRLQLEMNYFTPGMFHNRVAYGKSLPVVVTMLDFSDENSAGFELQVAADSTVTLSEMTLMEKGEEVELDDEKITGRLLDTLTTPLGKLIISPAAAFVPGEEYNLVVSRSSLYGAVMSYTKRLSVMLADKKATAINLVFQDNSIARADDVLDMLITIYNENWVKDKNQIAVSTSLFINERLRVIERELGSVDKNISKYRSENLLVDEKAASTLYLNESSKLSAEMLDVNNQLYMTQYIKQYLVDAKNRNQLLPANSVIENGNVGQQITEYNSKMLQRNNLVANSSEQNPLVIDMDQALVAMRQSIISSLDNQVVILNEQLRSLQKTADQNTSRIAASPTQAKYLLSVERQQKVKEALYLFLLQKREENELSQAFTAYNTRIITPPHGSRIPVEPKRNIVLLAALMLGLAIPVGIIYLLEMVNTKVRGRKDLEGTPVPFVGEIPQVGESKRKCPFRKTSRQDEQPVVVVKQGSRSIVNEAFRVMRTNLEFMRQKDKKCEVIIITSFNPGSGKSFLVTNLSISLALKGKRILCIDGDLRRGSASAYIGSPKIGLSDYLSGRVNKLEEIIYPFPEQKFLDVIPMGTMPPNPTELLFSERLGQLIETCKERYDYIFIDCPPIELVADTQILSQYADRSLFVVRAGLLERSMLPELKKLYNEKKYPNMALILNGTVSAGGRYGYKYGYHYGYGNKSYYSSDDK